MSETSASITVSFEELLFEDNFEKITEHSEEADAGVYRKELQTVLAETINTLKPKEKQVVTLYYYEKLKFSDIGKVLGITEGRVSQIHSKAMLVMKHRLQDYIYD
jgi:RNA polymerase sigma factor for flagellar operon FliA